MHLPPLETLVCIASAGTDAGTGNPGESLEATYQLSGADQLPGQMPMFGFGMWAETFSPTNTVSGESDFTISVIPSGFRTFARPDKKIRGSVVE